MTVVQLTWIITSIWGYKWSHSLPANGIYSDEPLQSAKPHENLCLLQTDGAGLTTVHKRRGWRWHCNVSTIIPPMAQLFALCMIMLSVPVVLVNPRFLSLSGPCISIQSFLTKQDASLFHSQTHYRPFSALSCPCLTEINPLCIKSRFDCLVYM